MKLLYLLAAAEAVPTTSHSVRQTGTLSCTQSGPAVNTTKLESFVESFCIAHIGEAMPSNSAIRGNQYVSDSSVTLSITNQCSINGSYFGHQPCLDGLRSIETCPSDKPNFTLGGNVSSHCLDYKIVIGVLPTILPIVTRSQAEKFKPLSQSVSDHVNCPDTLPGVHADRTACKFGSTTCRA